MVMVLLSLISSFYIIQLYSLYIPSLLSKNDHNEYNLFSLSNKLLPYFHRFILIHQHSNVIFQHNSDN